MSGVSILGNTRPPSQIDAKMAKPTAGRICASCNPMGPSIDVSWIAREIRVTADGRQRHLPERGEHAPKLVPPLRGAVAAAQRPGFPSASDRAIPDPDRWPNSSRISGRLPLKSSRAEARIHCASTSPQRRCDVSCSVTAPAPQLAGLIGDGPDLHQLVRLPFAQLTVDFADQPVGAPIGLVGGDHRVPEGGPADRSARSAARRFPRPRSAPSAGAGPSASIWARKVAMRAELAFCADWKVARHSAR